MAFVVYPEIKSDNFYDDIYKKKEFFKTRIDSNFLNRKPEEVCKPAEFKLEKSQEFVRNFVSFETPYNGIILFHGTGVGKTCAAISITEGLKDYVYKMEKKIYIISSEHVRENFYNELYNPRKAKLENAKHSAPGSFQCAGNAYHISESQIPNEEYRLKKIRNNIKKYYEFMGPNVFSTYIDVKLKKKLGLTPRQIAEKMVNSVIVIDEAHGIVGRGKNDSKGRKETNDDENDIDEPDEVDYQSSSESFDNDNIIIKSKLKKKAEISQRTLLHVLLDLAKECRNIGGCLKIILLTATPMKDESVEIADLLELLNINDGVQIDRNKLFPTINNFNADYLYEISKGYISYVRGNNPISFPKQINPPVELLYEPNPLFNYSNNTEIVRPEYLNYLNPDNTIKYDFNLYKCNMSIYQFKILLITKQLQDTANKNGKQAVCFVYPQKDCKDILTSEYFPTVDKIKYYSGINGFKKCFNEVIISTGDTNHKKEKQYEFKKDVIEEFGYFLMLNNDLQPKYNLAMFSAKFANIINNINSINGISYCFCEYGLASAVILGLCLEANGFIKYNNNIVYDKNGLPINLESVKSSHMLNLPYLSKKNYYRCAVCGQYYNDCVGAKNSNHKFKMATYIIKTGLLGYDDDIQNITNPSNKYGNNIKVLIGTKVTGEGLDLKWVRQVHIVDPWHNNTRIYQIIGRGVRNCSHIDLKESERNVCVYRYSAAVPDIKIYNTTSGVIDIESIIPYIEKNKLYDEIIQNIMDVKSNVYAKSLGIKYRDYLTETVDELLYRRIVNKDFFIKKIERVLKETAIDCELNKNINNYWDKDVDYSRECDYNMCYYKCRGFKNDVQYVDISLDLNNFRIKSVYFFKTNEWQSYLELENQKTIIDILNHFNINYSNIKYNADANIHIEYNKELINKLKYYINIKGAYYDSEKNKYVYETPLVDLDISTYNIYFSQPQINMALLYIRQLFQHNLILKEENIIQLINNTNALIDVEFIRAALGQLVGNKPYVQPITIKDKYNRLGYILYINEYYMFQPFELLNQKIPIYYKNNPLQIKKSFIELNNLKKNTHFDTEIIPNKEIFNIKNINVFIMHCEYLFNKNKDNNLLNDLINIALIRYEIDKNYTLFEQEEIYKYIIIQVNKLENTVENETNNLYKIANILTDYYKYLSLVHIYKNVIYIIFNYNYIYKFNDKINKWIKIIVDESDSIVMNYNEYDLIPVNNNITGIYGFMADSYTKFPRVKNIYNNKKQNFNRTLNTINKINSYIQSNDNLNNIKFKFNNKINENVKSTFDGDKSKKTFKSGLNCNQNTTQARELLATLFNMFKNEEIYYKDNRITVEFLEEELYYYTECDRIAILLKILDIIEYKKVRWFLSPFETEYFIPLIKFENVLY